MEYLKKCGPLKILQKWIFHVLVSVEPMVFKTLKLWRHTHIYGKHLPYLHTFDLFAKVISELVAWSTHSMHMHARMHKHTSHKDTSIQLQGTN